MNNVLSSSHKKFPPIPATPDDFVSMGLNMRPTLFGCDPTSTSNPEYPLVLYLPNAPPFTGEKPVSKCVRLLTLRRASRLTPDKLWDLQVVLFPTSHPLVPGSSSREHHRWLQAQHKLAGSRLAQLSPVRRSGPRENEAFPGYSPFRILCEMLRTILL